MNTRFVSCLVLLATIGFQYQVNAEIVDCPDADGNCECDATVCDLKLGYNLLKNITKSDFCTSNHRNPRFVHQLYIIQL